MAHTMLPPLSPLSQYINTPVLTFYVLGVCELETPFTKAQTLQFVEHGLIPINKRFSSIIVTDEKGVQRWKKIQCCVEDHVIVPTFPSGLSPEEYDEKLEEYLSDIAMKQIPETRPPWEVHLIVYPTTKGEGSLVFKINHAIGDGYSFMGALFALFKRADNPSIALKYPTASSRLPGLSSNYSKVSTFVYRCINTVSDLTRGVLGMYLEDDHTILRSKTPGVEYAPVNINSVTYSLEDIRQVRTKIGATVNDVTTGIIAYALQLYMKRMGQIPLETKSTGLIVMNLRMYRGFKSLDEMLKANIWGNHFGFLRVSLPSFGNLDEVDPLEYIQRSKSEMQKQMNSMANYFTTKLLYVLGTIRGPEAAATYLHSNLRNTSIMITNMCGPTEQASIAGHPLKHFYFTVPGVPQSIVFTIVSYMGTLRLVATTEKGFIDSQVLVSCMKEAFQKMYIAAIGEDLVKFH